MHTELKQAKPRGPAASVDDATRNQEKRSCVLVLHLLQLWQPDNTEKKYMVPGGMSSRALWIAMNIAFCMLRGSFKPASRHHPPSYLCLASLSPTSALSHPSSVPSDHTQFTSFGFHWFRLASASPTKPPGTVTPYSESRESPRYFVAPIHCATQHNRATTNDAINCPAYIYVVLRTPCEPCSTSAAFDFDTLHEAVGYDSMWC